MTDTTINGRSANLTKTRELIRQLANLCDEYGTRCSPAAIEQMTREFASIEGDYPEGTTITLKFNLPIEVFGTSEQLRPLKPSLDRLLRAVSK